MDITRRYLTIALAALSSVPRAAWSAPGVMLAREAGPGLDPRGWLVSEKLDGVRALWDGQLLRFRSGRAIAAPRWFTEDLPAQPLDGELWLGRGRFEALSGTVRQARPLEPAWRGVRYALFDLPASTAPFADRAAALRVVVQHARLPFLLAVEQFELPDAAALHRRLAAVVRAGGEGLMLHRADALHRSGRSDALLKLKPLHDAEATVIGHEPGQGRHAGHLGALRVRSAEGRDFRIGTGFSDAQRDAPPPPGSVITYSYRGLSAAGLPRHASFLRVCDET